MIGSLTYEEISNISKELKKQAEIIDNLIKNRNVPELNDFAATVEGYSKFIENTIEINKDADKALSELANSIK